VLWLVFSILCLLVALLTGDIGFSIGSLSAIAAPPLNSAELDGTVTFTTIVLSLQSEEIGETQITVQRSVSTRSIPIRIHYEITSVAGGLGQGVRVRPLFLNSYRLLASTDEQSLDVV